VDIGVDANDCRRTTCRPRRGPRADGFEAEHGPWASALSGSWSSAAMPSCPEHNSQRGMGGHFDGVGCRRRERRPDRLRHQVTELRRHAAPAAFMAFRQRRGDEAAAFVCKALRCDTPRFEDRRTSIGISALIRPGRELITTIRFDR